MTTKSAKSELLASASSLPHVDDAEQPKRKHPKGDRGVPPLPTFKLSELDDDVLLTQREVAAVLREAVITTETRRLSGNDDLVWVYLQGRPRATVRSLRQVLRGGPRQRRPAVRSTAIGEIAPAK
jgi:hypothetical protein